MGYTKEAYQYALNQVEIRHQNAIDRASQNLIEAYAKLPELEEIDKKISLNGIAAVKAATQLKGSQAIDKYHQEHLQLEEKRREILKVSGYSETEFEPQFTCKLCSDNGYANGKLCQCALQLARNYEFDKMSSKMPIKDSTFDTFDLKYYSGSAHDLMTSVLSRCKKFASNFELGVSGMIFFGKTGVGKTHLSLSIANEVLKNGYGVVYGTASEFLGKIEKEHFGKIEGDTLQLLCECDLLIIDDLGAEFQTQFTASAIHELINRRIMEGKPSIISTNLSPAELAENYGDRVSSRIIGNFEPIKFEGNDIRQIKMVEKMTSR